MKCPIRLLILMVPKGNIPRQIRYSMLLPNVRSSKGGCSDSFERYWVSY